MKNWKRVQGSQAEQPAEFDNTSSSFVVYQRRNIHRVTLQNMDGSEYQLWEYEERTMSHDEYALMVELANTQKDIATIEDILCSLDAENQED